jgi:hypothetical protein
MHVSDHVRQNIVFPFPLFFLYCCWWIGVHCSIYIGSYSVSKISHINSPLWPFSFIPSSPDSCSSFNRYYFCIYSHVYTFFALYSHSYLLFPNTSTPSTGVSPPPLADLFHPPVLWFCWRKRKKDKLKNMTF